MSNPKSTSRPSSIRSASTVSPENTVVPSADHAVQSTGWSCCVAALGRLVPLGCTSQQRTWLSHEPATSRLATGENARLETPSEGGDVTSKSLLGLCVGTGTAAPKAVPKADMASEGERR